MKPCRETSDFKNINQLFLFSSTWWRNLSLQLNWRKKHLLPGLSFCRGTANQNVSSPWQALPPSQPAESAKRQTRGRLERTMCDPLQKLGWQTLTDSPTLANGLLSAWCVRAFICSFYNLVFPLKMYTNHSICLIWLTTWGLKGLTK